MAEALTLACIQQLRGHHYHWNGPGEFSGRKFLEQGVTAPVSTDVKLVPITTIERSIGKAKRVVDKRPK